jgi:hypothetical protein
VLFGHQQRKAHGLRQIFHTILVNRTIVQGNIRHAGGGENGIFLGRILLRRDRILGIGSLLIGNRGLLVGTGRLLIGNRRLFPGMGGYICRGLLYRSGGFMGLLWEKAFLAGSDRTLHGRSGLLHVCGTTDDAGDKDTAKGKRKNALEENRKM